MLDAGCAVFSQNTYDTKSCTDDDLTAMVQDQSPSSADAVEELLRRYDPLIYRACLSYLRDTHLAEDATQEVHIRVYRGIARYEGRSSFRTWLYRIVRNECHTTASHQARHRVCDSLDDDELLHPALVTSDGTEEVERNNSIEMALSRLPVTDQEVLKLRFFHELSLSRTASQLGTSLSGAKMRLYRALARFEKVYLGLETDEPGSALT